MDSSFDSIDTILYLYNAEGVNCAVWGRSLVAFLQAKKPLNSVPKWHQTALEWLLDGI